ncbi:MAG: hypothetical protein K0R65_1694 [Crocinitomicaceae bacterium]|nr:hypothetical protein [Crocinitomicaceae bacterium]
MKNFYLLATILILIPCKITLSQRSVRVRLTEQSSSLNVNFPLDYSDRTFIKGLAMFRNEIEKLAGSLIILEDNGKAKIIGQYIKHDQGPLEKKELSDVLYSSKINFESSVNGSYMIASISASSKSIIELIITDINGVLVPEESIPYLEICSAAQNMDKEIKKKIYYVRSAKLTSVHSKAYSQIDASTAISGTVFSIGGKVYNSSDQFKNDYVVSVDLIDLNNLLMTKNCEELITSNELAIRQLSEKAKQDAEKAETERKIKENEFNMALAEVNSLKNKLSSIQDSLKNQKNANHKYKSLVDSLTSNLNLAQESLELSQEQLTKANDKSKEITQIAMQQETKSEGENKLIQKSDISVITEVQKLSEEEIKGLGFEQIQP